MINKLFYALSILGLSASAAYAGHVEEMMPVAPPAVNVTIPQQAGSWVVGGELDYWSSANGDLHYGHTFLKEINGVEVTDFRRTHTVEPDYDLGYHIDLGYNFEGDGRYVQLGWTHLDSGNASSRDRLPNANAILSGPMVVYNDTATGVGSVNAVPATASGTGNHLNVPQPYLPYRLIVGGAAGNNLDGHAGWDSIRGSSSNDLDVVDLVFGQRFDFNQKVTLAAFGGLRYADIENRDTINSRVRDAAATVTNDIGSAIGRTHMESEYWGVGPRAGFNAQVRLGAGASIVGTFAGSLLVGDAEQKQRITTTYFTGLTNNINFIEDSFLKIQEQTRVVPELDARIGVNYTVAMSPNSSFGIELGYHVENYFDVKDNSQLSYVDTMSHNNDYAVYGPYLRLQAEIA